MSTKIPSEAKYTVSTKSDLFGNIHYTKNCNFDEEGYLKLSSRSVSLFSEADVSNLRLPVAFGRKSVFNNSIDYFVTTAGQKGYWLTLIDSGITLNVDVSTGVATLDTSTNGCWFQNLWTYTNDTDFFTRSAISDAGTTTDRGNLTSGKEHPIAVFVNKVSLCIGDGNTVKLFDSSYNLSKTLTLPADFEVVGLSYSNNKMGVIAMLSDTAQGQNQDAYFFTWDGSTTEGGQGLPIGSDKAIAITAYKGSWLILTRKGQLRYFTGGGWDDSLPALPFYYQKLIWGTPYTRDLLGDVMRTEGDRIFINFNAILNAYGRNYEQYSERSVGGILCLDPNIGLYNRYTPSVSPISILTVTSANVNTTTNVMTKTAGTIPTTGSPIKYISDKTNQIGGLRCPNIYYCIKLSSTTFSLAETKELAESGVAIDLTSTGASNNYFMALEVLDYGQCYANKSGGIAELGEITPTHDHLIYGVEINDYASTGNNNHINITIPDFESRGYAVTSLINSQGIEDLQQKIYVKFRPLKDGDKIIIKAKTRELIGLPITTPQTRISGVNQCTWTGTTSFYTSANLEDAKTAFDKEIELECEFIAGAGAGVIAKISNITYEAGVYSVTFDEPIQGAGAGRYSDIKIDNWKKLGEVTNEHPDAYKGYVSFNVGEMSPDIKFKVELQGSDVAVKLLTVINTTDKNNQ